MEDPLAQFRKKPITSASSATAPSKGREEYVAFDAKDKVMRLKIKRARRQARAPDYACLLDITSDDAQGTTFVLIYMFMLVLVRGRNLKPVIAALEINSASFIQEFDARRWDKPKDEKAPFIESIEVVIKENGPKIADGEADSETMH